MGIGKNLYKKKSDNELLQSWTTTFKQALTIDSYQFLTEPTHIKSLSGDQYR